MGIGDTRVAYRLPSHLAVERGRGLVEDPQGSQSREAAPACLASSPDPARGSRSTGPVLADIGCPQRQANAAQEADRSVSPSPVAGRIGRRPASRIDRSSTQAASLWR